jgi:hypothetical protein
MPSAALYVVVFTFACGFESYLRSQSFSELRFTALCLRSVPMESKLRDLRSRSSHLIRNNVAINIEGRSDIGMAHHLLLNGNGFPTASNQDR